MDMEEIGYFLFMQDQEEKLKVNAEIEDHLVREEATTKEDQEKK